MQDLARRYRVLTMVLLGAISIAEASRRLSLSYRQTWTLYDRFRAAGGSLDSLRYQRDHAAPNRTSDEIRDAIFRLHERYPDAGHTALTEILKEDLDIRVSAQTVRRIRLQAPDSIARVTPIRRAKGYPSHDARLLRLERLWVPTAGRRHVFQLIEDDVTGRPLIGWMFERGTALDTLMMIRWLLEQQGAPHVLFVPDSASFHMLEGDYDREIDFRHEMLGLRAQIHQMLLEVGTRVEMPRGVENPRMEQWAEFARDARRAATLNDANAILQRHLETLAGGRYGAAPIDATRRTAGRFTPIPSSFQFDEAFCVYLRRRVDADGYFRLDGAPYRVSRGLGYRGWVGIELGVRVIPAHSVTVFYQGEQIEQYPLENPRPVDLPDSGAGRLSVQG
ncbi:MAG: helix-turn-helix domain-containing protein [Chloroflexota bacterium]|nr:MAG: helix-turn-helix domain-containing protein [Chloroflexota bacterium]